MNIAAVTVPLLMEAELGYMPYDDVVCLVVQTFADEIFMLSFELEIVDPSFVDTFDPAVRKTTETVQACLPATYVLTDVSKISAS